MGGWRVRQLGDLLEIQNGYAFKSKQFSTEGEVPLIRIRDLDPGTGTETNYSGEYDPMYIVQSGDMLIGMDGDFQCHIWNGPNALLNQRVCRLENFADELNAKFLFYGINKHLQDIHDVTGFTTVKHLSSKSIKAIRFPLPPLPEQKHIVAILDEAFAGIATAVANTEKNLTNARELFESHLNAVFTQKGKGWVEKTLGDSCKFYNGKPHEKKIDKDGDFIVVNSKFISSNGVTIKKTRSALFPLYSGDIAMVMSDVPNGKALAKCCLIDEDKKYTLNQRICVIRSNNFNKRFLYYHLNRHPYLLGFNNGENQTNLRKGDILKCPLYVLSMTQQEQIADHLDEFSSDAQQLKSIYQQKLDSLDELKQSILQRAFTGELTAKPDKTLKEAGL